MMGQMQRDNMSQGRNGYSVYKDIRDEYSYNTYVLGRSNSINTDNVKSIVCDSSISDKETNVKISSELLYNLNKIERFKKYKYDWNGNGAAPISSSLINKVRDILFKLNIQPEVFPTAADSIQLEYDGLNDSYLEFQIYDDDEAKVYAIDINGDNLEQSLLANPETINEVVDRFYGQ